MTLRQFEVFLAVARAKSFRRAAEAVHLSQPALSQHVRELEANLGASLFDRLGRSVQLTEAGRILEDHATRMFATLTDARQAIADLQGLQRGALAIGASTTPGIYVLPGVLGAFRQRYPAVEVSLNIANSKQIVARVHAGEFDLAVVGHRDTNPADASLATCVEDELVLVVGPTHAWANRHHIAPAELATQPLLLREPGSATRLVTEQALTSAGVAYRPGMILPHTEAIKQGVIAGLGVAFVSICAMQEEQVTGRLRPLRVRGLRIVRTFHLIHHERRSLSTAGRAFTELFAMAGTARRTERAGRRQGRHSPSRPQRFPTHLQV
jgi:DNA-binding transcriptional LysR family regulator